MKISNEALKIYGIIFFLLMVGIRQLKAQSLSKEDKITYLKHYDKDHLLRIALPLGGIGTGTVSLGGRGELKDWEIMNVPAKGYSTVTDGNDAPFFAIHIEEGKNKYTKALLGPLYDSEYEHYEGRSVNHHGLPRFESSSFDASYPFGRVNLSDLSMPVIVKLTGFNPLIPGDADASGIPIAILNYEVENITSKPITVSISGNIRNFIGKDGSEFRTDWKGDYIPIGAKKNQNEFKKTKDVSGIYMFSNKVDKKSPAYGTIALTTPNKKGNISYRTSSTTLSWSNSVLDFWDDFSDDGVLTEKSKLVNNDPMASLAVQKTIAPGEKKSFIFYLTWHFPNRFAWSKTKVGNYYCTKYSNAWDVIEKEVSNLPLLKNKTVEFVNSMVNSSFDKNVIEAALFNLSTLRSQTVFRTLDGRMFGWEGVMDSFGSCKGSCTHVWNYEQATAFLFGDLAKSMREVEFDYATNDEGRMSFRVELPLDKSKAGGATAADGQMGTIMKFYRDWQLSGDHEFLQKHWKKVKAVLSYAWIKDGWDRDKDGVMEGVQHNTMDVNYIGPNPQMQIWYLGALKAGSLMAAAVGDMGFSKTCNSLFKKGKIWTDKNLFNGEYYEQIVMSKDFLKEISSGESSGFVEIDQENSKYPDYQLAKGCLVDQLVGQYMAHVIGLGYIVDKNNVKTALQSILKYNQMESMSNHFNNMRTYAMGNESALLMASFPKGRPKIPFPYFSEVMTGFEYTAAIGMLYEGMEKEGLHVIKNIRDRYNGSKRSPFDEAECGHHYARAMASWAAILAESEFHYSGVDKFIVFTSKSGKYFWSNGYAWGVCEIESDSKVTNVKFTVLFGAIELKEVRLKNFGIKKFKKPRIIDEKETIFIKIQS